MRGFMKKLFLAALLTFPLSVRATSSSEQPDPFIWLEQVEERGALNWVMEQNQRTLDLVKKNSLFAKVYNEALTLLNSDKKIPRISLQNGYVYNLHKDSKHIRGVYRRMSLADFQAQKENWETILDIDELGKKENESWVFQGLNCYEKNLDMCILSLSRGGKDASVKREFSLKSKSFKTDGFTLTESKASIEWYNENQLLVSYDMEKDAQTSSGYPRWVKLWNRGQNIQQSDTVFKGQNSDVSVYSQTVKIEGKSYMSFSRSIDFFNSESFILDEKGQLLKLPIPTDAEFIGVLNNLAILKLASAWNKFPTGSVISLSLVDILQGQKAKVSLIASSTATRIIENVGVTNDALYIELLENVKGQILKLQPNQKSWTQTILPLPKNGSVNVIFTSPHESQVLIMYGSYLNPSRLYLLNQKNQLHLLKELPQMFNAKDLVEEQLWTTSKDGTRIPYFIVHKKNINYDGKNPTLLYGYGGFKVSLTPSYSMLEGKTWFERGGVYVVANIRGGGEFGPEWHLAALKKNRQKAYDDFIAVAESLISKKITSPKKLAIEGGSNGGLLVGAVSMQRPDLFKAVICEVPLLDMIRYTQLPPGASWIGEYGDPADPEMRSYIEKYSPYQNVSKDKYYPSILFTTSTKDDRVHPGHARKMTAKMQSLGHQNIYLYENTEGGHGGGADNTQLAHMFAITKTFLFEALEMN